MAALMRSPIARCRDPALRRTVLRISPAAARADGYLADGEAMVVEAARHHWRLVDGKEPIAAARAIRRAA